eukprot:TRINITY_DN957_c0_g1_i6.p8 TRINITY_DN957_c0_g1~~TRINITY_DN957_c0_g1_i6.p8  ORF type:complete len:105 (-),score=1.59 TRINITY_DN957_c0_g1_i6:1559-1873(-)
MLRKKKNGFVNFALNLNLIFLFEIRSIFEEQYVYIYKQQQTLQHDNCSKKMVILWFFTCSNQLFICGVGVDSGFSFHMSLLQMLFLRALRVQIGQQQCCGNKQT